MWLNNIAIVINDDTVIKKDKNVNIKVYEDNNFAEKKKYYLVLDLEFPSPNNLN